VDGSPPQFIRELTAPIDRRQVTPETRGGIQVAKKAKKAAPKKKAAKKKKKR